MCVYRASSVLNKVPVSPHLIGRPSSLKEKWCIFLINHPAPQTTRKTNQLMLKQYQHQCYFSAGRMGSFEWWLRRHSRAASPHTLPRRLQAWWRSSCCAATTSGRWRTRASATTTPGWQPAGTCTSCWCTTRPTVGRYVHPPRQLRAGSRLAPAQAAGAQQDPRLAGTCVCELSFGGNINVSIASKVAK
jgi:hypothetical protein